jgi:SAM-dependent methyltransferase
MTRTKEPGNAAADPVRIEAFAGESLDRLASAWTIAAIHIGDRLGLYPALTEGAGTAEEIASRASTNPRLIREWLDGQVAAGIVELDSTGRYALPIEHAAVLAVDDSPVFLAGAGGVLAAVFQAEDRIINAFRGDGRLAWGDQAPCLFGAVDRFYRTGYAASLIDDWIPSLSRAVADLECGGRVADVGCGRGTALVMLAEAFPAATFVGIDNHDASLVRAGERVASSGVANVRLVRSDAATFGGGPFHLICFLDALHDMGDPAAAIRHARTQLTPTGSVMLVEPAANESVVDSVGDVVAQLYYPGSTFLCTPNALAQGDVALGNQVPETTWRDLFARAGFSSFERVAGTPFNRVFEARI